MSEPTNNIGRGPLGVATNSPISDPGTSALIQNRPNAPIGTVAPHHVGRTPTARLGGNRELRTDRFPLLKIGARGNDVQRLQRLVNLHLEDDHRLKVDGVFGPKTRAAVIEFQKDEELKPDGLVGRDTWFSLVSTGTQEASWKAKPPAPATRVVASSSTTATKKTVDQWSLTERFEYVLTHTGPYLGPDIRAQFTALLTPTNLGIMVGSLVVWAAGHFFGVSEIADAFLLGFGLVFLGKAAIDAARLLKNVIEITCSASTEAELEDAAKDLAEAIAIIGVVAFFALLAKVGRAIGNKLKAAKAAKESGAPVEEEAAPQSKSKSDTDTPKRDEEATPPEDPIAKRRELNKKLRNSPQFERDLTKAKVSQEQLKWMDNKQAPLGFQNPEQFESFKSDLADALRKDGLDDAQVGMKGTATTFYSENPGKPAGHFWDADPTHPGDYDLNLASDKMAQQMQARGIQVSPKYGIYRTADINSQFPAVSDFSAKWSATLGRDVNVVGYPAETVPVRDPTEFVLVQ